MSPNDPEVRNRLEIVCHVRGFGSPRAKIWFFGLEEAKEWDEDPKNDSLEYEKYSRCIDGWLPGRPGEIERDAKRWGKNYTKIYNVMSHLILQLTTGDSTGWKSYRNNKLFMDGIACQTNLYPLGKRRHNVWPAHYAHVFGIGESTQEEYTIRVSERLERIKSEWREAKPPVTICFGKGRWDRFKEVLELVQPCESFDGCELYSSGVILTPFLNSRFMSSNRMKGLGEWLRMRCCLGSDSRRQQ